MKNEYEEAITQEIMQAFGFEDIPNSDYVRCKKCGKRLGRHYIGKPINERMIEHSDLFHKTGRRIR